MTAKKKSKSIGQKTATYTEGINVQSLDLKGDKKNKQVYPKQLKEILKDVTEEEIKLSAQREFEANKEALLKQEAEANLNRLTTIVIEKSKEVWRLRKFDRSLNPVSQSSEPQKDFNEWAEINIDLIISKIRSKKYGWKMSLFKLATQRIDISQPTFYRILEKFEKTLK